MRNEFYLPRREADLILWLNNFNKELLSQKGKDIISDSEIDEMINENLNLINEIEETSRIKEETKGKVAKKNITKKNTIRNLTNMVGRIKLSDKYSEGLGKGFNIISSDTSFNSHDYQPKIEVENIIQGVKVSFTKGLTEGVNVYRKNGSENWEFVARKTKSPFIDKENFNAPSKLEYMAVSVIDDEEIGKESKIVTILTD